MTESDSKKKFSKKLLIIFIALLLVFNAFLIFQMVKKNKETTEELVSTISLKEELQKEAARCLACPLRYHPR